MAYFISSLLKGMSRMEEIALWLDSLKDPAVGVELIAFTHDEAYWQRLCRLLPELTCPVTFHGPYIGTEATCEDGSMEQEFLLDSYDRVIRLAQQHGIRHIVYHYTQKGCQPDKRRHLQQNEQRNRRLIQTMANQHEVNLLIENLPNPVGLEPLYTLTEYSDLFAMKNCQAIIDIGHAHMNGMDLEGFLKQHGDLVSAYHFHNNDGIHDQHREIFDGTFDFSAFAGWYRTYTSRADIVLEYEPHVTLDRAQLLAQINWLKENFW